MARTKEVFTYTLNHVHNVGVRNGKVSILVQNPDDKERIIWVEIGCDALELSSKIQECAIKQQETARTNAFKAKIAKLEVIANDENMPESLRFSCLTEIENLKFDESLPNNEMPEEV